MSDSMRPRRQQCQECFQWREDYDRGGVCRACRLQKERDEAREVARDYRARYWSVVEGCGCEDCLELEATEKRVLWLTKLAETGEKI